MDCTHPLRPPSQPYVLLSLWAAAIAPPRPSLRFSPGTGTFKIMMLTDLHYGEAEPLDAATDRLQAALLAAEAPDLVVFGGDQVSGWASNGSAGFVERHWRRAMAPVVAAGVPHSAVLGNHGEGRGRGVRGAERDKRAPGPRNEYGRGAALELEANGVPPSCPQTARRT